jgi:ABC-type glycerol-3-phosphate transport system substrate-binding protein
MHNSIDSFSEGKTAMMLNYSWHYDTLKAKNSKLNFAVAPISQFSGTPPANFANYWTFVVAKNKGFNPASGKTPVDNKLRIHESWQFIKFLTFKNSGKVPIVSGASGNSKEFSTTMTDPAKEYLKETRKPAARRDIIEEQKNDPFLSPFAVGNLIAKSWQPAEAEAAEAILLETIDLVIKGRLTTRDAINLANSRINQLSQ